MSFQTKQKDVMELKISEKGLALIKEFEGCHLTAYQDEVGVWTIGWGITNADKAVTGATIKKGLKITREKAEKWLRDTLNERYAPKVNKYNGKYNWSQNEFDALVSFAFNIGSIDQLTANGTRSKSVISNKMLQYNKAGGKVYNGLTRRRKAERTLFLTPVGKQGYSGAWPVLPPRGYYQIGDGYNTLKKYKTQIKRVQKLLNWITGSDLKADGLYGHDTAKAQEKAQKILGLTVNGKFGNQTLKNAKNYKK